MDEIKCKLSGKTLSNFKGEITINPDFEESCRIFKFRNVVFRWDSSESKEINIENFVNENEDWEVFELYPKITAKIDSPFSGESFDMILADNDMELEKEKIFDHSACEDDSIEEASEFNEDKEIYYYELYLISTYGKYRGTGVFDFSRITTKEDLLEATLEDAYDSYEWYEYPTEILKKSLEFFAVNKDSNLFPDEPDGYCSDLMYLLRNEQTEEVKNLLKTAQLNDVTLKEIAECIEAEFEYSWFGEMGCKTIEDVVERYFSSGELKEYGKQFLMP